MFSDSAASPPEAFTALTEPLLLRTLGGYVHTVDISAQRTASVVTDNGWAGLVRADSVRAGPGQPSRTRTRPDRTRPDRTRTRTRPDRTGSDRSGPDRIGSDR